MAKKPAQKKVPKQLRAVQFRAGATLEDILDELAGRWQQTKHETARRLACLAAFDFSQRHYELLVEHMEGRYGRADFVEAAHEVYVHLEAVDVELSRHGALPMVPEDRDAELARYVREYILLHRVPEEPETQKQRIYIVRTD